MKLPGESARLYVDMVARVREGDYIRTTTGRLYLVEHVRVQARGKWAGRQHVETVVMDREYVAEADAVVHDIIWYRR